MLLLYFQLDAVNVVRVSAEKLVPLLTCIAVPNWRIILNLGLVLLLC